MPREAYTVSDARDSKRCQLHLYYYAQDTLDVVRRDWYARHSRPHLQISSYQIFPLLPTCAPCDSRHNTVEPNVVAKLTWTHRRLFPITNLFRGADSLSLRRGVYNIAKGEDKSHKEMKSET